MELNTWECKTEEEGGEEEKKGEGKGGKSA